MKNKLKKAKIKFAYETTLADGSKGVILSASIGFFKKKIGYGTSVENALAHLRAILSQ